MLVRVKTRERGGGEIRCSMTKVGRVRSLEKSTKGKLRKKVGARSKVVEVNETDRVAAEVKVIDR